MEKRFGRWVVLRKSERTNKRGQRRWAVCLCDCGKSKEVDIHTLNKGISRSCGCLRADLTRRKGYIKGREKEHHAWRNAINRCYNKRTPNYYIYGGRGITMCAAWRKSFLQFYADIGPCPGNYTLERVNNNRGYAPDNCIWTTKKANCRNKTTTRWATFEGKCKPLIEWAEIIGIAYKTLHRRLQIGWSVRKAFTTSVRAARRTGHA